MATITLEVDDATLARARAVAESANVPVEVYLARLLDRTRPRELDREALPPHTRSALGMLKGLPDKPIADLVGDLLAEDHGLRNEGSR